MNQITRGMSDVADLFIHDVVANYSAYHIPVWQDFRIKHAISLLSEEIANKLDYTTPSKCVKSIAKELDIDVTPYIVKHKFPVWVDLEKPETLPPKNKNAVITFVEDATEDMLPIIQQMEKYAEKISADFILLQGRTQGYLQLEKHRIKAFAELYERIIYISSQVMVRDDMPDLFKTVPEGSVGIFDDAKIEELENVGNRKLFLLRAEAFTRSQIITSLQDYSIKDELKLMTTNYDDSVIVCDKKHASIWSPFTFPYRFTKDENRGWIEILLYREGHEVFLLDEEFNCPVASCKDIDARILKSKAIRYSGFEQGSNIYNTWLNDNDLTGYKQKNPVDMSSYKVLSLGHKADQFQSIQNRDYLEKIDLNSMYTKYADNSSEARVYESNFDNLFPEDKLFVGITTASWNLKYIGLNPIDEMHNWAALEKMSNNTIICADCCSPVKFTKGHGRRSVLKDVYPKITPEKIQEFLKLVQLDEIDKQVALSNQIIASREILKSLFRFYQDNEILEKIDFFLKENKFEVRKEYMVGRGNGYFAETVTMLWLANQDFVYMPQEILRNDWYFK